jgi:hypothetical protein
LDFFYQEHFLWCERNVQLTLTLLVFKIVVFKKTGRRTKKGKKTNVTFDPLFLFWEFCVL